VSSGAIFLTIDLDLVDYLNGDTPIDECGPQLDPLLRVLQRHPDWTVTWLVRVDGRIEVDSGDPTSAHAAAAHRLRDFVARGHELAWHPHAYVRHNGRWAQNTNAESVARELRLYAPVARGLGLRSVRMGWGFHTNETMHEIAAREFSVDSTAIPRPVYPWDRLKDWSTTPERPYRPSRDDYRLPGSPALPILELPISVATIRAPYDAGVVVRYLNPAYQPTFVGDVLRDWFATRLYAVLVTHPHELFPTGGAHPMLALSADAFEENVVSLEEGARRHGVAPRFLTLSHAPVEFGL
jgi:hypothetical protein